jgi:hypothetical protein
LTELTSGSRFSMSRRLFRNFDETRALETFERIARWEAGKAPETYPAAV